MATIKDVAAAAGVSIATVSNMLTGKKNVSPEKTTRILDAMKALNYDAGRLAVPAEQRSMTIGFIVSQLDTVYFPLIIRGIQRIAEENGYSLIFYPTNYSSQSEKKHLKSLIASKADGIILDTVVPDSDRAYWESVIHVGRGGQRFPIVSIQNDLSAQQIPSVYFNSFESGYIATKHLIEKGCKKIACITGPSHVRWAQARFDGYRKCLEDNGLPYNSSYTATGDCTPASGYRIVNYFLLNALEFDGIFAENDLMALGAIKALMDKDMRVPEDVRVIGHDNVFVSSLTTPSISTIHVPKQRLGEEAARDLIGLINHEEIAPDYHYELPLQLIERQSTNISEQANWDLYLF